MVRYVIILMLLFVQSIAKSQNGDTESSSVSEPQASKDVLLLGVYHFDNPGKDTYNLKIDDYLLEKRQKEIEDVVSLLAEYEPTKIFVEFLPVHQRKLDSLYGLYGQNQLALGDINGGRNEVYQIGFRLAKEAGLENVIAADHQGVYLGPYADFLADTLSITSYEDYNEGYKVQMNEREEKFRTHTVKQNLMYLNTWSNIMNNHNYYNNVAITVKDTSDILFSYQKIDKEIDGIPYQLRSYDFNNIGIELVTEWYKRNLFIYRNILENTDENDRICVIFGAGHLRYLRQLFEDNKEFTINEANTYLSRNK